ncbi:MAG: UxaA family hydrolase [Spirochaetaceae bacterium]|nr:UxaA family hydrolase [Spirochaetaceae bacterium]
MSVRIIQIHETDNVAIPVEAVSKGAILEGGLTALDDIPQGHKIALRPLAAGEPVIRYGAVIGYLKQAANAGAWINETMIEVPPPPDLDNMPWGTASAAALPVPPRTVFRGYDIPGASFAGIRNILAIMPAVQCVSGVVNAAVEKMKRELLPRFPQVDDIVPLNHAYGCGVAMNVKDSAIWIGSLKNLLRNPNFGGEIMVVGLGCEMLTPDMLLDPEENAPENVIILQECRGFTGMIDAILSMAEKKLHRLNARKRTELPLSKLCVGMQCGGSDAFSGITSNPVAGYASDLLAGAGAAVLFSETTEVRDGVHLIAARCAGEEAAKKLAAEMRWYDAYLRAGGADRTANPSPGNKKGGLATIIEKALGCIAKSGTAPVTEVLSPGERPSQRGLIFAGAPASDMVCGAQQLASGIVLQVFMTGRGTPYGLASAPVIKVSSRTILKELWPDLIDLNAGTIAEGSETIAEAGLRLFNMIIDAASGDYKPWAERYKLHNDLTIFNPAPIT